MIIRHSTAQCIIEVDGGMKVVTTPISTVNILEANKTMYQLFTGRFGRITMNL